MDFSSADLANGRGPFLGLWRSLSAGLLRLRLELGELLQGLGGANGFETGDNFGCGGLFVLGGFGVEAFDDEVVAEGFAGFFSGHFDIAGVEAEGDV